MNNPFKAFFFVVVCTFSYVQCEEYEQGKILYEGYCANCHMNDGTGLEQVYPPLANADFLRDNQTLLPCIISKGILDSIVVNGHMYSTPMGGYPHLNDVEITNLINYINNSWGNQYGTQKLKDVQKIISECPEIIFD